MTAAETVYGRRGGGWLPKGYQSTQDTLDELAALRAEREAADTAAGAEQLGLFE